jgi:hypothetical protein
MDLTESLDMALFFAERYPALQGPQSHRKRTEELLRELHTLDYYSLSFSRTPLMGKYIMNTVRERLAMPEISQAYRDALNFKLHL